MHASHAIAVATVDPTMGSRGTRRLLVALDDPSVSRQSFADPGFRPLGRSGVTFDDTFVPAEHEITAASSGSGLSAQLSDFDLTRTLLGLMVIGAARRAIDSTIEWVQPLVSRSRGSKASRSPWPSTTPTSKQRVGCATGPSDYVTPGYLTPGKPQCAKWWAPRLAVQAINDCIVLHGHVGWSTEMPLQQLMLDVSGLQIGDGTPQIQKLVIARNIIGRG
jgi:cyclohexanecarboxyl-CoA dehydrogenase